MFTLRGRTESDIRGALEGVGLEADGVVQSTLGGKKRVRSLSRADSASRAPQVPKLKDTVRGRGTLASSSVDARHDASIGRSKSAHNDKHFRSQSATRGPTSGSVAPRQIKEVAKSKRTLERHVFRHAKAGESEAHLHVPQAHAAVLARAKQRAVERPPQAAGDASLVAHQLQQALLLLC
jgi:hypothetical protein